MYRGAALAHLENGAAGLYDGHQDEGGDAGYHHVQLDVGRGPAGGAVQCLARLHPAAHWVISRQGTAVHSQVSDPDNRRN